MIDWDQLNELSEDVGTEDFAVIVSMFFEETDEVIARLTATTTPEADYHFLKGSATSLGLVAMAEACGTYEQMAALGTLPTDSVEEVITLYEAVKSTLQEAGLRATA